VSDGNTTPISEGCDPSGKVQPRFIRWLEEKILPFLVRLTKTRALIAVQDTVVWGIPFVIGGFVLFYLISPEQVLRSRALEAFRAGIGCMSLWVSFRAPWKVNRLRELEGLTTGLLSLCLFYLTFPPFQVTVHGIHSLFTYLAEGGLFVAFVVALLLAEIERQLYRRLLMRSVSPAALFLVSKLGAFLVLLTPLMLLGHFGIMIHSVIRIIFIPLMKAGDSLPWLLIILFCICLLQLTGVHGSGIIGSITMPIYLTMLQDNAHAAVTGQPLPHIVVPPFILFSFVGGTGSTLPLCVMMLRSRCRRLKKVALAAIMPGIFNINEPMTFGLPVIMNPMLALPFLISPLVVATLNYTATLLGFVERMYVFVFFFIPHVALGYAATAFADWRMCVLSLIDFALVFCIYFPFFKAYERKMLEDEKCAENEKISFTCTCDSPENMGGEEERSLTHRGADRSE
jgi:PTS system cellobiose-specific IIC component